MGLLDDHIIKDGLPHDPWDALRAIVERYEALPEEIIGDTAESERDSAPFHEALLGLFAALIEAYSLDLPLEVRGNPDANAMHAHVRGAIQSVKNRLAERSFGDRLTRHKESFAHLFSGVVYYDFPRTDLDEIQGTINKLRDIIGSSTEIQDPHRQRMLERVEALQREFHRRMSSLDSVFGKIFQIFGLTKLLGEDRAEAASDALLMIADITWRVMTKAEGLPDALRLPMGGDRPELGSGGEDD